MVSDLEARSPSPRGEPASGKTPRRIASEQLLGPTGQLLIVHGGREYRLRVTQNGKLILTA
jgi:hemin uptake protein HemP